MYVNVLKFEASNASHQVNSVINLVHEVDS